MKSNKLVVWPVMAMLCVLFLLSWNEPRNCVAGELNKETAQNKWDRFALLVIDVQHFFWNEKMLKAFPGFPQNISALLDFCRSEGIEVIHLRARFSPDMSDWPSFYKLRGKVPCVKGTDEAKVRPFAQEIPGEMIIYKHSFDGFLDTGLADYLDQHSKKHLFVAGISTGVCVLNTCFTAFQKGYLLTLLEDCCAGHIYSHKFVTQSYNGFIFEIASYKDITKNYSRLAERLHKLDAIENQIDQGPK